MAISEAMPYALITPARNEAKLIGQTIESVIAQTQLPCHWIIISDGSTDATDDIVRSYAEKHDFIQLLRRDKNPGQHDYSSKVFAIREGIELLSEIDYQYLGMLDADISFEPDYYQRMLAAFAENPKLGIAGGLLYEPDQAQQWQPQAMTPDWSVSGPIQLFRRECYEQIGGYLPLRNGEDAISEVMSRMHGWEVRTLIDVPVKHHRPTYSAKGSRLYQKFWEGSMDYRNGTHPVFQLARGLKRIKEAPFLLGGLALIVGYYWTWISGESVAIPKEVKDYLRREQMTRLRALFGSSS